MNFHLSFPWNIPHYHHVHPQPMYIVGCLFIVLCLYGYFVWIGQSTFWTHQPLRSHHTHSWESDTSCFELIHRSFPPHPRWYQTWTRDDVIIRPTNSLLKLENVMKDSFYPIYRDVMFEPRVLLHNKAISNIHCFEMVQSSGNIIGCFAMIPTYVSAFKHRTQSMTVIDLFWIHPRERGKGYAQMAMGFIASKSSLYCDGASCITFTKENYMLSSPYHRAIPQSIISIDKYLQTSTSSIDTSVWKVFDMPSYEMCRSIVQRHVYEFPSPEVYESFIKPRLRLLCDIQTHNWILCVDRGYRRYGKIVFDVHLYSRSFHSNWNPTRIWGAFLSSCHHDTCKVDTLLCVPTSLCDTFSNTERGELQEMSCGITYEYTYNCVVRPHLVSFLA